MGLGMVLDEDHFRAKWEKDKQLGDDGDSHTNSLEEIQRRVGFVV